MKRVSLGMLVALLAVTGCNDDFVNTQPLTEVPQDDVWKDGGLAEAFVNNLYAGLGNGGFDEQMLASLTDEAIFTHPGRNINTVTEARSNPSNPGWINGTISWGALYARIRAANLALEKLATPQFPDEALAARLRGEATFMRAYNNHQLLRYYGAFPIIERTYALGEADYLVTRNTFEECVNAIVKDADAAAQLLDGTTLVAGRASKAAALALKSRVLLYAASDLHHIPTASAKSNAIASYSNPELIGYTGGDRNERWMKARDAAKAVLDLPGFGYALEMGAPVAMEEGIQNYVNASLSRNGGERELIFARYFINAKQEGGARQGLFNGPNGYHNWAGNAPLQNLVDDYEMMDGTRFNWSNPEHAATPYANRDPRFYASILYDGAVWKPRPTDVTGKDPVMTQGGVLQLKRGELQPVKGVGQIQTGQYEIVNSAGAKATHFGLDTRQSSVEDWNGTRTGYYTRKFIDPDPNLIDQNAFQQVPWPFFRYTEAVFNYAEALIELGNDAEALVWLNKIRFRAGMPALTETGPALKERYRNERRVEMAYEEQRYHDARRWMIAPATLGRKAGIVNIIGTLKPGKTVSVYRYDPLSYNYAYTPLNIDPGIENRAWDDKMYYLPIHRDEINRNNKLVQNPGY
jgi:hypothetical protein